MSDQCQTSWPVSVVSCQLLKKTTRGRKKEKIISGRVRAESERWGLLLSIEPLQQHWSLHLTEQFLWDMHAHIAPCTTDFSRLLITNYHPFIHSYIHSYIHSCILYQLHHSRTLHQRPLFLTDYWAPGKVLTIVRQTVDYPKSPTQISSNDACHLSSGNRVTHTHTHMHTHTAHSRWIVW